jgi:zinc transporter ZupT
MKMGFLDFITSISVVLIITIIHFIGEKISEHLKKWHIPLESFGAGLMVGILFLELLPLISDGEEFLGLYVYIPLFVGFIFIAIVEKIIYRRVFKKELITPLDQLNDKESTSKKIDQIADKDYYLDLADYDCIPPKYNALFEAIALTTHSLMIGILVSLTFYEETLVEALVVMIPFGIRGFTLSFSTEQIMEDLEEKYEKFFRIISFFAPTLGAVIGLFLILNMTTFFILFAFAIGVVLFGVIRDMIPLGKKGNLLMFLIGCIITIIIFLIFQLISN